MGGPRAGIVRLGAIALATVFFAGIAAPAWAPPQKKQYDAALSPASAVGGTAVTITLTITNLSSTQEIGSANVAIPAGFTAVGTPTIASAPAGKTWTAALAGGVVELRNPGPNSINRLARGEAVSVAIPATTPCAPGSHTFLIDVRQSNDFNGSGNEVFGPDATFTVTSGCAHHLDFEQEPSDALAGQPNAPAVTVRIEDAAGALVAGSTAPVTLALQVVTGDGALFGTTTVNAAGGVATFSDLVVSAAGTYRLVATSPGLLGDTSAPFGVTGFATQCASSPCGGGIGNVEDPRRGHISGALSVPVEPCAAESCPWLTFAEQPGDFCPGGCRTTAFLWIPPANASGLVTVVLSCDKRDCPGTGVANFAVWQEKDGAVTEIPTCTNPRPTSFPCISHRSRTGVGDLEVVVLADPEDPRQAF